MAAHLTIDQARHCNHSGGTLAPMIAVHLVHGYILPEAADRKLDGDAASRKGVILRDICRRARRRAQAGRQPLGYAHKGRIAQGAHTSRQAGQ